MEERYHETPIRVRFQEVDAYQVAWHGHYVGWLEVARNDLAEHFGVSSASLLQDGYLLPVIGVEVDYKRPALVGDNLVVQTRLREPRGAMFVFEYRIVRESSGELLATARTRQVVLNRDRELLVTFPTRLRSAVERIRRYHRGADLA